METTKLYYEDAYLREFDAAVLSCREEQGRYLVVLDRTAFYPEGGGQPADHGVLGGVAVTDAQERDGVVCHTCAGPLAVVYREACPDRGAALRREAAIKKLSRQEKLRMIQYFHSCFYASNESSPWGFSRTDT